MGHHHSHRDGQERKSIANKIPCSLKTVNHWINRHNQHGTVADKTSIWTEEEDR